MPQRRKIVSHERWFATRKRFLGKEKSFTRLRDRLSAERRGLPWERVEKEYVFDGPDGKETLAELFDGRRQLMVDHFMVAPEWDAGCPSCSFWADNFDDIVHLAHRDVTMVALPRAVPQTGGGYRKRMGWTFKWLQRLQLRLPRLVPARRTGQQTRRLPRRRRKPRSRHAADEQLYA